MIQHHSCASRSPILCVRKAGYGLPGYVSRRAPCPKQAAPDNTSNLAKIMTIAGSFWKPRSIIKCLNSIPLQVSRNARPVSTDTLKAILLTAHVMADVSVTCTITQEPEVTRQLAWPMRPHRLRFIHLQCYDLISRSVWNQAATRT